MEEPPRPDWSALPADLQVGVLAMLEIPDLFSMSTVCRSWNKNYVAVRRLGLCSQRQQSPYLLYSSAGSGRDDVTTTLHRLSTGRRYHVTFPTDEDATSPLASPRRHIVGCSHGWLVIADDRSELHLVNPVTPRARIALPPVTTLAPVRPFYTRKNVFIGYTIFDISPGNNPQINNRRVPPPSLYTDTVEATRRGLYLRAVLSSDPGDGSSCTVVLLHKPDNQLSFARPGDSKWTSIALESCQFYHDCIYDAKDGFFYALRRTSEVHAIDLSGSTPVVRSIFPSSPLALRQDCTRYIVRAPWGDLLQIWRKHRRRITIGKDRTGNAELRTFQLTVFKMLVAEKVLHEIKDLQGHALFIGFSESFFVAATDYPMLLTPDCVYLAHDSARHEELDESNLLDEVLVFNMKDGSLSDFLPRPKSWLSLPPPIWIRPSMFR